MAETERVGVPWTTANDGLPVPRCDWAAAQLLSFSTTAGVSAAITSVGCHLVSTEDCWVTVGASPTATVGAGSMFLKAGDRFAIAITSGHKVSAIRETVSGVALLSIIPFDVT